jgi:hypothetical protein
MTETDHDASISSNEPSDTDLASFSDFDLLHWRQGVERQAAEAKRSLVAVDTEITRRYGAAVDGLYAAKGEMSGKVKTTLPNGLVVEGDRSKRVEWDGAKLLEIAKTMSWEQVQHFFKISVSMAEATFKALDPTSELRQRVAETRTVKYGDAKIALVEPE